MTEKQKIISEMIDDNPDVTVDEVIRILKQKEAEENQPVEMYDHKKHGVWELQTATGGKYVRREYSTFVTPKAKANAWHRNNRQIRKPVSF